MAQASKMERMSGLTRRTLLAALPLAGLRAVEKGKTFTSTGGRYADPATEFSVDRLTDPQHPSYWPLPYARSIAKRGAFFLYGSDQGDGLQAYRYELKTGEVKLITAAEKLHVGSLNLI